jgi:hypothetical protein
LKLPFDQEKSASFISFTDINDRFNEDGLYSWEVSNVAGVFLLKAALTHNFTPTHPHMHACTHNYEKTSHEFHALKTFKESQEDTHTQLLHTLHNAQAPRAARILTPSPPSHGSHKQVTGLDAFHFKYVAGKPWRFVYLN